MHTRAHTRTHACTPRFPACPALFGDTCVPSLPAPPVPCSCTQAFRRAAAGTAPRPAGRPSPAAPPLLPNRSAGHHVSAGAESGSGGLIRGSGLMTRAGRLLLGPRGGRTELSSGGRRGDPQESARLCGGGGRPPAPALERGESGWGGPAVSLPPGSGNLCLEN